MTPPSDLTPHLSHSYMHTAARNSLALSCTACLVAKARLPAAPKLTTTNAPCHGYPQAKMFGYMSLAWGLGTVVGPLVGGALARPCDNYRHVALCGPGQLFRER